MAVFGIHLGDYQAVLAVYKVYPNEYSPKYYFLRPLRRIEWPYGHSGQRSRRKRNVHDSDIQR